MAAPIGGTVRIRGVDPLPLAVLTDDYLQPTGRLTAELNLGGTIGYPLFSGSLRLVDGRLGFPELGIGLEELHGTVAGVEHRLSFDLQARSGTGTVRGSGGLDFAGTGWSGAFTIDGTDCDLVHLSELQIVVSPSVRLRIGPDGGDLSGVVRVPRALIQPEEMQGSVGASADVVFVDQVEPSTAWPFFLDVQVVLEDQVTVKGYGLNTGLDGSLDVSGRADQGLVGRGELRIVRGTFSLYGTPLQISRGRLVFGGGAIDNPELDIVAQKTVQSAAFNGKGALVGVNVSGNAQDYYLELFSEPSMPDNDIVAYLLLDKPIGSGDDQARGLVSEAMSAVGLAAGNVLLDEITEILPIDDLHLEGSAESRRASLVVAKRLTDQLSISYDFNLFEHAGAFRVRYEFGRGFSVQSRSSVEANGLEVLYTFER
ncbi:translocation/assembly module TamB domain-containing protein [Desulfofustis limnaeus]